MTDSNRKLKVKFGGRWRDELQCRSTKVKVTTPPHQVRESIKDMKERIRDYENILEVLEATDFKENRPSIGELLFMTRDSQRKDGDWMNLLDQEERDYHQKWATKFIQAVIDERYITEKLTPVRNYEDASEVRSRAVQAAREVLERRWW